MASIAALTTRVDKLYAALKVKHRVIILLHEVDSHVWIQSLDGTRIPRVSLDAMLRDGHTLIIREMPMGYLAETVVPATQ